MAQRNPTDDAVIITEDSVPFRRPRRPKADFNNTDDDAQWVLKEIKVGDKLTVRKRVRLTPAMCETCGWDALDDERFGFGQAIWEELDEVDQKLAQRMQAAHVELHTPAQKAVLTTKELRELNEAN